MADHVATKAMNDRDHQQEQDLEEVLIEDIKKTVPTCKNLSDAKTFEAIVKYTEFLYNLIGIKLPENAECFENTSAKKDARRSHAVKFAKAAKEKACRWMNP